MISNMEAKDYIFLITVSGLVYIIDHVNHNFYINSEHVHAHPHDESQISTVIQFGTGSVTGDSTNMNDRWTIRMKRA